MGNVEVAYGVYIQSLCHAVVGEPFFPKFYEKYKKSIHNLNNFPLFTSFS